MASFGVAKTICGAFNGLREGSSIIAGGCLRDKDLGRDPHDIDLIIEYEDERDIKLAEDFGEAFGYDVTVKGKGYIDKEVACVLAFNKKGEVPIDVIFLTVPVIERLAIFPCNICKIHTDHTGVIVRHKEYVSGIANKEIIYNEATAREKYVAKMHDYFPDWSHDMDVAHFAKIDKREPYKFRRWLKPDDIQVIIDDVEAMEIEPEFEQYFQGPAFDAMKARHEDEEE